MVGFNSFAGDPFNTTGFIWTDTTGVIDINDFLLQHNITTESFSIWSLLDITPDGRTILGFGRRDG